MLNQIKTNIHLCIVIISIILVFVIMTILLIIRTNNNLDINHTSLFKKVEKTDTIDIYEQFDINPIEIVNLDNKIQIYGLIDETLENTINTKLLSLTDKEDNTSCTVNFNVSNVLSVSCNDKHKNINLTNGANLTIEDVFSDTDSLQYILIDKIQNYYCENGNCKSNYNPIKLNEIENNISNALDKIRLGKYQMSLNYRELNIYIEGLDNYITLPFYEYMDNVSIFNRFKNEKNIYKNGVQEKCTIYSCLKNNNNKDKYTSGYTMNFNDKSIIHFTLNENINLKYSLDNKNKKVQDTDYLGKEILDKIIEQKNLSKVIEDYSYVDIEATIYETPYNYNIVNYNIIINKLDGDNYIKMSFGEKDYKITKIKDTSDINIIINSNNKVEIKDTSINIFENLSRDLSKYINSSINKNGSKSVFYLTDTKLSIEELINNSFYLVDKDNEQIFMHYFNSDENGSTLNDFIARIPLNKIKLK